MATRGEVLALAGLGVGAVFLASRFSGGPEQRRGAASVQVLPGGGGGGGGAPAGPGGGSRLYPPDGQGGGDTDPATQGGDDRSRTTAEGGTGQDAQADRGFFDQFSEGLTDPFGLGATAQFLAPIAGVEAARRLAGSGAASRAASAIRSGAGRAAQGAGKVARSPAARGAGAVGAGLALGQAGVEGLERSGALDATEQAGQRARQQAEGLLGQQGAERAEGAVETATTALRSLGGASAELARTGSLREAGGAALDPIKELPGNVKSVFTGEEEGDGGGSTVTVRDKLAGGTVTFEGDTRKEAREAAERFRREQEATMKRHRTKGRERPRITAEQRAALSGGDQPAEEPEKKQQGPRSIEDVTAQQRALLSGGAA